MRCQPSFWGLLPHWGEGVLPPLGRFYFTVELFLPTTEGFSSTLLGFVTKISEFFSFF